MEDPKQNDSLNLIDTSSKRSQLDFSNNDSKIKEKSKTKDLILEEKDEEDEKINNIENELNENEKLKNLMELILIIFTCIKSALTNL